MLSNCSEVKTSCNAIDVLYYSFELSADSKVVFLELSYETARAFFSRKLLADVFRVIFQSKECGSDQNFFPFYIHSNSSLSPKCAYRIEMIFKSS